MSYYTSSLSNYVSNLLFFMVSPFRILHKTPHNDQDVSYQSFVDVTYTSPYRFLAERIIPPVLQKLRENINNTRNSSVIKKSRVLNQFEKDMLRLNSTSRTTIRFEGEEKSVSFRNKAETETEEEYLQYVEGGLRSFGLKDDDLLLLKSSLTQGMQNFGGIFRQYLIEELNNLPEGAVPEGGIKWDKKLYRITCSDSNNRTFEIVIHRPSSEHETLSLTCKIGLKIIFGIYPNKGVDPSPRQEFATIDLTKTCRVSYDEDSAQVVENEASLSAENVTYTNLEDDELLQD